MRAFFTYWWFFKILMTFTHGQLFGPQGVQQFNLGLYQVFKQLLKIYFRTAMIGYDTYFTIKSFRSGSMINIRIFWKKKWFLSYRIFYTTLSWYFVYDNIKQILLWRLLLLMIRLAMWSMGLYFIQHD